MPVAHSTRPSARDSRRLLDYGDAAGVSVTGASFLVVPRLGTISAWASKATDIAHNTGLKAIRRIERGTLYVIGLGRKRLNAGSSSAVAIRPARPNDRERDRP